MYSIRAIVRVSLVMAVALSCVLANPATTLAEANTDGSAPTQPSTGPKKPPGPAGGTYTYNTSTGLWENEHYTWNPATQQTQPKQPKDYSYNPSTGMWDTSEWVYSPEAGKYTKNSTSQPKQPTNAPNQAPSDTGSSQQSPTPATDSPSSTPESSVNNSSQGAFDLFYNSSISNNITSNASSGNATVSGNTNAGSALTGDALTVANVFNLLQSSWSNLRDQGFVSFISNIFGDAVGDILLDPNTLSGTSTGNNNSRDDMDVNIASNNSIKNDISLVAQSGNATVSSNTAAGDATSGSANALANVVNMINSIIGSGRSFFGLINIHGNLDGDILMPESFLANLLASNAPRASIDTAKLKENDISLTDTQSITNNTALSAQSGQASVTKNTAAGNAITGDTNTNLTIFNLTGKNIVGSDSLLVFVNVLGEWIGMIVNTPEGTTTAALGDSSATATDNNTSLTSDNTGKISNNISLASTSGDATVHKNTAAGNATTGSATASANLVNITNSTLNLSNWFGILFINVFGSWHGSFGVNTANGTIVSLPSSSGQAQSSISQISSQKPQAFRYVSHNGNYVPVRVSLTPEVENQILGAVSESYEDDDYPSVAAVDVNSSTLPPAEIGSSSRNLWVPAIGTLIGALLFAGERLINLFQKRSLQPNA